MTWPVIVKDGPNRNQTLSTIEFDSVGCPTNQPIHVCQNWVDGFIWAQSCGYSQALFVDSGTIILDWAQWKQLIDQYPHSGLIGHLIWHPGQQPALDEQCWFMNIDQFQLDDFSPITVSYPTPVRSEKNLHDDYTPLWVRPGHGITKHLASKFGQGLIARQLNNSKAVVNWNNTARDLKFYMYTDQLDFGQFQKYKDIAENQLWIFNNEPITVVKKPRLVSPGSGLSWMLNIIDTTTEEIQIVDISRMQIKFCQTLWNNWDGDNYGKVVWDFINQNKLKHYELDNPNLSPLERLKLKSRSRLIDYVNAQFTLLVPEDFQQRWLIAKQTKRIDFCNDNLIQWVIDNNVDKYDNIWCSNILKYKWTLLHTTVEQYDLFQSKLK